MKVFISWSGVRSHHIATALRDWLPSVIQAVDPFISTQDIAKGSRGNVVIASQLEEANIGIICLTPENLTMPWILFEAGALSKLSSAYVCTYLYELEPSGVQPPLGQFQHTKATKIETKALIQTINRELPDKKLSPDRLDKYFEQWWPSLDEQFKQTPARPDSEKVPKARSDASKIDEILDAVRRMTAPAPAPAAKAAYPSLLRPPGSVRSWLEVLSNISDNTVRVEDLPTDVLDAIRERGFAQLDSNGVVAITGRGMERLASLRRRAKGFLAS